MEKMQYNPRKVSTGLEGNRVLRQSWMDPQELPKERRQWSTVQAQSGKGRRFVGQGSKQQRESVKDNKREAGEKPKRSLLIPRYTAVGGQTGSLWWVGEPWT